MANKYQENQNNQNNEKDNKNNNRDIYRNDSKLTNKNSYMIYELNNTFEDKGKDVFDGTANGKSNINKIDSKLENKK